MRILQAAGVSFAILGAEETCNGDPARRIGNEYLWQTQAQQNIGTFARYVEEMHVDWRHVSVNRHHVVGQIAVDRRAGLGIDAGKSRGRKTRTHPGISLRSAVRQ